MKKFQLDKVTYNIPTSFSEVTLEMQLKVSEDSSKIVDNEVLQRIALISGYANIPIEVLKRTSIKRITELFKYLAFMNEPLPTKPISEFEFNGEKYEVGTSIAEGQFQDWVSIETAFENHKEDSYNAMPIVLAILAKKENETLDDYDVLKRAEEFKQLPLTIVEPLRVFFSLIGSTSQIATQLYSKESQEVIVNAKVKELRSTLNQSRHGGVWYMRLLNGMLQKYLTYFDKGAQKYFNSIQ